MNREPNYCRMLLTFALLGAATHCYADIVKCQLSEGAVMYSDEPCQQAIKETVVINTDESDNGLTRVEGNSPIPGTTKPGAAPKQTAWATKRILPSGQMQVDVASVRAARLKLQSREKISVVSR